MTDDRGVSLSPETLQRIAEFAEQRDWLRFHTPKNLSMALAAEAGELLAEFQWLSDSETDGARSDGALRERVISEIADITIYLQYLVSTLDVDLDSAVLAKIAVNESRFRADASEDGLDE